MDFAENAQILNSHAFASWNTMTLNLGTVGHVARSANLGCRIESEAINDPLCQSKPLSVMCFQFHTSQYGPSEELQEFN